MDASIEAQAQAIADNPVTLLARLKDCADCLIPEYRKLMRGAKFDPAAKTLTGKGLRLHWQTRRHPDKPIDYWNQQNSVGFVRLEFFNEQG